jgi:hypothetical protein
MVYRLIEDEGIQRGEVLVDPKSKDPPRPWLRLRRICPVRQTENGENPQKP